MARRLRLSELRTRGRLAPGRWPVRVLGVQDAQFGDRRYNFRPDPHAADGVVHRLLVVRHRQGRDLGVELEAGVGDRLVPNRLGDAAPTALGVGASGRELLTGKVQVDETYIGGAEPGLAGGRVKGKKVLTGIAVEVREPRGLGRCRISPLPTRLLSPCTNS